MANWYPDNKDELDKTVNQLLGLKTPSSWAGGRERNELKKEIHGLIVPHAGYQYSGKIAGKAFSLLKNKKIKRIVILSPSHYTAFLGVKTIEKIQTPLGEVDITKNSYSKLKYEHSVDNQIPFLQKLGIKEILPLVIGEITESEAEDISKELIKHLDKETILIFSTDLSHFFPYETAVKKDKETIKIIENLDINNWNKIDACGIFPLLILMNLCKIKSYKPKLIEYKNSGDITGDKSSVVGYSSFWF